MEYEDIEDALGSLDLVAQDVSLSFYFLTLRGSPVNQGNLWTTSWERMGPHPRPPFFFLQVRRLYESHLTYLSLNIRKGIGPRP